MKAVGNGAHCCNSHASKIQVVCPVPVQFYRNHNRIKLPGACEVLWSSTFFVFLLIQRTNVLHVQTHVWQAIWEWNGQVWKKVGLFQDIHTRCYEQVTHFQTAEAQIPLKNNYRGRKQYVHFYQIKRSKGVGMRASGQLSWMVSRWPIVSAASEAAFTNADIHLHNMPSELISTFARLPQQNL